MLIANPAESSISIMYVALPIYIMDLGTATSLNITRVAACCTLTTGTYLLGRVRWNRIDTNCQTCDTIRYTSVGQDWITPLVYGTSWGRIDVPKAAYAKLTIYDILCMEIESIPDEKLDPLFF